MTSQIPEPVHDLLTAVLEAMDVPHPATTGGAPVADRLLAERVMHARGALRDALADEFNLGPAWYATFLRERLAEHPVTGYVTVDQAHAALEAGKSWSEAVTLPAEHVERGEGQ